MDRNMAILGEISFFTSNVWAMLVLEIKLQTGPGVPSDVSSSLETMGDDVHHLLQVWQHSTSLARC